MANSATTGQHHEYTVADVQWLYQEASRGWCTWHPERQPSLKAGVAMSFRIYDIFVIDVEPLCEITVI